MCLCSTEGAACRTRTAAKPSWMRTARRKASLCCPRPWIYSRMMMKKHWFILLLLLGATASAATLPEAAQQAADRALRARGVKAAPALQSAVEEAYRQGASG